MRKKKKEVPKIDYNNPKENSSDVLVLVAFVFFVGFFVGAALF